MPHLFYYDWFILTVYFFFVFMICFLSVYFIYNNFLYISKIMKTKKKIIWWK